MVLLPFCLLPSEQHYFGISVKNIYMTILVIVVCGMVELGHTKKETFLHFPLKKKTILKPLFLP